ncbi:sensor domain-containing diguanylate cyclase [Methylocystis iwaonis]|nr:GGDEF domain-containing protein [Methylocystis iwaonis]
MRSLRSIAPLLSIFALIFCAAFFAGMTVKAQAQGASDISSLWSWAVQSWTTETTADGRIIKVVHEPFALTRNLALIALTMIGGTILVTEKSSASKITPAKLAIMRGQLDEGIGAIIDLLQGYAERNQKFADSVLRGSAELAKASSPDRLRSAIEFLISENQKMLKETEAYQASLRNSRDQISKLRFELAEKQAETQKDTLTSAFNRRYFDAKLANVLADANRRATSISLILADLDHFKSINDEHGHLAGDEVLKMFADQMQKHVRAEDTVARFGGEEFAVILPHANIEAAVAVAEKMRRWLYGNNWKIAGKPQTQKITASFGVAQSRANDTPDELIKRADSCLYASKSSGRNRVTPSHV